MSQSGSFTNASGGLIPGNVAQSYVTNSGTAIPVANILNVVGSGGITTSGSGNTVTVIQGTLTGTFSPSLLFGGGNTNMQYNIRQGIYHKIGDILFYTVYINLFTKGISTGSATISGFPFSANVAVGEFYTVPIAQNYRLTNSVNYSSTVGKMNGGTTSMFLLQIGQGQDSLALNDTNCGDQVTLAFSGFYKTT